MEQVACVCFTMSGAELGRFGGRALAGGRGVLWLLHSHVWGLMLAVSWDLSRGCTRSTHTWLLLVTWALHRMAA